MRKFLIAVAVVTLCSCSADQKVLDKIQACENKGGTPVYIENGFTGNPTQYLYCDFKNGDNDK